MIRRPPSVLGDSLFGDDPARARATDPDTSHAAAASVTKLTTKRLEVLRVLKLMGTPASDEQLVAFYPRAAFEPQSVSGIRTRRRELADAGLVEQVSERGVTVSGRSACRWQPTPAGLEALRMHRASERLL